MSENQPSEKSQETQGDEESEEDTRLLSDSYEKVRRAIEILYIKDNIGARTHFIQDWPDMAHYLFGEELIRYDTEGTDDRDHRSELENIAEEKRLELEDIAVTLEEKSVIEGVLQVEYVEGVVKELGRDLALLFYASRFVDRIFPPPPEPEPEEDEDGESSEGREGAEAPDSAEPAQQVETPVTPEIETPAVPDAPSPIDVQPLDVQPLDVMPAPVEPEPLPAPVEPEIPTDPVEPESNSSTVDPEVLAALLEPAPVDPEKAQDAPSVFKQLLASKKAEENSEEEPPSQ